MLKIGWQVRLLCLGKDTNEIASTQGRRQKNFQGSQRKKTKN